MHAIWEFNSIQFYKQYGVKRIKINYIETGGATKYVGFFFKLLTTCVNYYVDKMR